MIKLIVISAVFATTLAGVIHDDYGHGGGGASETDYHHETEHKHATSHQSFKVHHFHPVPVYVKKEDQHFLKHPVEVSGVKHKLKLVHPETEHSHGHGLTLENHSEFEDHKLGGGDFHGHEASFGGDYGHEASFGGGHGHEAAGSYGGGHGHEASFGGGHEGSFGGGYEHYSGGDDGGHEFHDINVSHHGHHE